MQYRFLGEIATADVAFEAWGETPEELFISSAAALLNTMIEDTQRVERRTEVIIRLEAEAFDLLLFFFLQELIVYKDARRLLLHAERVSFEEQEVGIGSSQHAVAEFRCNRFGTCRRPLPALVQFLFAFAGERCFVL